MLTSATGRSNEMKAGARAQGFTLLEIIVVIAVIGILISLAGLSVGNTVSSQRVDRSAERLLKVVALAEEQAVLSGKPIGISFVDGGYFLTEYERAWRPLDNNFKFSSHVLETGVVVEYAEVFVDANENSPSVVLLPDGENLLPPLEVRDLHSDYFVALSVSNGTYQLTPHNLQALQR